MKGGKVKEERTAGGKPEEGEVHQGVQCVQRNCLCVDFQLLSRGLSVIEKLYLLCLWNTNTGALHPPKNFLAYSSLIIWSFLCNCEKIIHEHFEF